MFLVFILMGIGVSIQAMEFEKLNVEKKVFEDGGVQFKAQHEVAGKMRGIQVSFSSQGRYLGYHIWGGEGRLKYYKIKEAQTMLALYYLQLHGLYKEQKKSKKS